MKRNRSAMKRAAQNEKRRKINSHYRSLMKSAIKGVREAMDEGKEEAEVRRLYIRAVSVIDRVASKGVIHRNKAARKKSRLSILLNRHFPKKGEAEAAQPTPAA